MPICHTPRVTLDIPCDEFDLEAWIFGLSDAAYQICAKGHRGAGVSADEYLFHLIPVAAGVRWILEVTPKGTTTSDFACMVQVHLQPILGALARLSLLGHFLANHVDEEAKGFAADITRKLRRASHALQRDRQGENPAELRSGQQPAVG